MAKLSKRKWYARVNAAWPAQLPELTPAEAITAARKLYRFVTGKAFPADRVKLTSGARYTWIRRGIMYVNPTGHTGHGNTRSPWESLVHDLSHAITWGLPHGGQHARLELRMIKEVLKRGWLDGRLKPQPKPAKPKLDPKLLRYQRTLAAIKRWSTKKKRAETALKKLTRSLRAQERHLHGGIVSGEAATLH
jgi:hypothetical protein